MTTYKGGCMCGAIRYEIAGEPMLAGNCHCRDCQKASGGGSAAVAVFPKANAKLLKGEAKYYTVAADSGRKISRGFCPNCGAPVFSKLEMLPDAIVIKASSLDDPGLYKPTMHLYTASAQPWDTLPDDGLARFPKMPE